MTLGKVAVGVQTLGAHLFSTDVFCVSCERQDSYDDGGDQNPDATLNRHEPEDEQQAGDSVRIRVSA